METEDGRPESPLHPTGLELVILGERVNGLEKMQHGQEKTHFDTLMMSPDVVAPPSKANVRGRCREFRLVLERFPCDDRVLRMMN